MYRTLLVSCFCGLLALASLAAGVAWWGAEQSRWQLERTRLANDVVQHYLRLRADIYSAFTRMAEAVEHPARVTEVREAEERRRILESLDRVRQGIRREVAFLGPGNDEPSELVRLGEIERGLLYVFGQFRQAKALIAMDRAAEAEGVLDRALREAVGNGFRSLVDAGVQEEEEEAAEAQASADRALALVAALSRISAAAVILLGVGGLALLLRRLQAPLRELESARRRCAPAISPAAPMSVAAGMNSRASPRASTPWCARWPRAVPRWRKRAAGWRRRWRRAPRNSPKPTPRCSSLTRRGAASSPTSRMSCARR